MFILVFSVQVPGIRVLVFQFVGFRVFETRAGPVSSVPSVIVSGSAQLPWVWNYFNPLLLNPKLYLNSFTEALCGLGESRNRLSNKLLGP